MSFFVGFAPRSVSFDPLTMIMYRMVASPSDDGRQSVLHDREVFQVVERPDLAPALLQVAPRSIDLQEALRPLNRFVLGRELKQRVAGDQLLGLSKRSVDHGALLASVPDPRPL